MSSTWPRSRISCTPVHATIHLPHRHPRRRVLDASCSGTARNQAKHTAWAVWPSLALAAMASQLSRLMAAQQKHFLWRCARPCEPCRAPCDPRSACRIQVPLAAAAEPPLYHVSSVKRLTQAIYTKPAQVVITLWKVLEMLHARETERGRQGGCKGRSHVHLLCFCNTRSLVTSCMTPRWRSSATRTRFQPSGRASGSSCRGMQPVRTWPTPAAAGAASPCYTRHDA